MVEKPSPVDRVLGLLGLARRAGKLALGSQAVRQAILRGSADMVVLATDASSRTSKDFYAQAQAAGIPVIKLTEMEAVGRAVGSSPLAVCAVCDQDFSRGIASILN